MSHPTDFSRIKLYLYWDVDNCRVDKKSDAYEAVRTIKVRWAVPSSYESLPESLCVLRDASDYTIDWPDWEIEAKLVRQSDVDSKECEFKVHMFTGIYGCDSDVEEGPGNIICEDRGTRKKIRDGLWLFVVKPRNSKEEW
ncbi:hypothetical protein Tco_0540879 [Tanacetum coccineum]